jgi:hypothetical protein
MSKRVFVTSIYLGLIGVVATSYLVFAAIRNPNISSQISHLSSSQSSQELTPRITQVTPNLDPDNTFSPAPTTTPTATPNVTGSQSIGNTTSNWAGYVSSGEAYTGVSGTWTVPQASGSGETSADATWIGIGGVTSDDLIQAGTQNVVTPNGQVESSAFYEMLPDTSQDITSVTINPGDSVTFNLSETSPGIWTLDLTDNTNGGSYSTQLSYNSSESSAEWIEEDPSDGISEIPFDDFGTVSFINGTTIINGSSESISASNGQAITMINSDDEPLATTSSLGANGSDFSVTRTNADSGPAIAEYNSDPGSFRWHGNGVGGLDTFPL